MSLLVASKGQVSSSHHPSCTINTVGNCMCQDAGYMVCPIAACLYLCPNLDMGGITQPLIIILVFLWTKYSGWLPNIMVTRGSHWPVSLIFPPSIVLGGEMIKINYYVGNSDFFKFRAGRYFFKVWESFIFSKKLKKLRFTSSSPTMTQTRPPRPGAAWLCRISTWETAFYGPVTTRGHN